MKHKIISIVAGLAMLLNCSCSEDFLETKSTSSVDTDQMFINYKSAMMAVNGLHSLMNAMHGYSSARYGGYQDFMLCMEFMGQDLVYTLTNAQWQPAVRWDYIEASHAYNNYIWKLFYWFTSNANAIIMHIDEIDGTDEEKNFCRGQALAYRAWAYFHLVQLYGNRYRAGEQNSQLGVILRLDDSLDDMPRSTVEEVYKQINDDLDEAIENLGNIGTLTKTNKSHIDVHVARGIKARVLLTQGRWEEAAKMAEKVIAESGAKLQDDTYTAGNRFSDQSNTEWLWGRYGVDDLYLSLCDFWDYMSNRNKSYNKNTPRAILNTLYDQISDTDVRKGIWFPNAQDKNVLPRPIIPTGGRIVNYMANKFLIEDENRAGIDLAYMRLPEMLLIEAEGYARCGKYEQAQNALYTLAKHRDPQYVKSTKTGDELIEEIMVQRRIELWGEGFNWLDLKRLDLPLDRGPAPRTELGYSNANWWTGTTNNNKMPTNVDPEASNYDMYNHIFGESYRYIPAGDKRWTFMIPDDEIDANPLCEQNPL
ncbi:MAG: RagB/SusD family nutrient uptake outer membrane protein [Prevotella sp.]|nr:RagB/SusD family nutrient uptake outer membrane protein [Prevotella sp.]